MRLPFRVRRLAPTPPEPPALPMVRAEQVLVALALHAREMSDRLERVEHRIEDLDRAALALDTPTSEDLAEVRVHSTRLSAEMAQIAMELQARIDDLEERMPAVVIESKRQERARTLAETIIDLSDSLDTAPVDLAPIDLRDTREWRGRHRPHVDGDAPLALEI